MLEVLLFCYMFMLTYCCVIMLNDCCLSYYLMFLPTVFVKNRDTVKPVLSGHLKILKTKVFKVDAL